MKRCLLVIFIFTAIFLAVHAQTDAKPPTAENDSVTTVPTKLLDRRPSFWAKTVNQLKTSTYLRSYKPYANRTMLFRKYPQVQQTTSATLYEQIPRRRRIKEKLDPEQTAEETFTNKTESDDFEDKIMKDESFIRLKEFAKQLVNETTKYFLRRKNPMSRSYPVDEPPPQHWDEKDQTYHASSFTNAEYEPTSFHHHYIPPPPPPIHYFPPQKKDDALLAKVALIALLKLILAKLKAIGFLKLMMFFLMKIPFMFFKFLFILKSFKLLKIISIPFLMASFAAPFLPLIPFFAPLLFFPMLFFPLLLPLVLPLLFFLPIVPVTTPVTASASTRTRRGTPDVNIPTNWSLMDDKWKKRQTNGTDMKGMYFRGRVRPASFENNKIDNKINSYEEPKESTNLIELTQRVVEAQQCMERVACELAIQNDSKIYKAAILWALEKVQSFAPNKIKRKIEKYTQAYEMGSRQKSSEYCKKRFFCQRPRIVIVQGQTKYNVF